MWLEDLAAVIQETLPILSFHLWREADEDGKNDARKNIGRVARFLIKEFQRLESSRPQKVPRKGSVYKTSPGIASGEDEEHREQTRPKQRGRKRSATHLLNTEQNLRGPAKRKAPGFCEACGRRGHQLEGCWELFPGIRPARYHVNPMLQKSIQARICCEASFREKVEAAKQKQTDSQR